MCEMRGTGTCMWSCAPLTDGVACETALLASRLWCRSGSWPTPKDLADEAGLQWRSSATRLEEDLSRTQLACLEIEELMQGYRRFRHAGNRPPVALEMAALQRVAAWERIDPYLVFLPLLACIAGRTRRDHQRACAAAVVAVTGGHAARV